MTHSEKKKLLLSALCGLALFALVSGAAICVGTSSSGRGIPQERYYRAVYLLQRMGGPAAEENVTVPPRVISSDATESLLHHPDKIFVLRRIADDLAAVGDNMPQAALFEAYARLGLGEREEAVRLLMRFVCDTPYQARYYDILCENMYTVGDFSSLLLICREWRERDSTCNAVCLRYTWAALYGLERYAEAKSLLLGQASCLGWPGLVYAAKTAAAMGERAEVEPLLQRAMQTFPGGELQVRRMWNNIKDKAGAW